MLKKLFCNDLSALKRRALPFLIATFGCGVLAFFILLLDALLPTVGDLAVFLDNTLTSILVALLFAFVILLVISELHIFLHYYQSFFSDEGYLTFMLPATREQLLVSKILAGGTFSLIILLVAAVTLVLGVLLPFEILMRAENASFLSTLWRDLCDLFSVLGLIDLLVTLLSQIIFIYTAITLGALFFQKRKMLGAFVFYCLLSAVVSLLETLLSLPLLFFTEESEVFVYLFSILVSFAVGLGGYFIARALLTRRLNLS